METLDKINNLPLNPMLEAATGSLHQSRGDDATSANHPG